MIRVLCGWTWVLLMSFSPVEGWNLIFLEVFHSNDTISLAQLKNELQLYWSVKFTVGLLGLKISPILMLSLMVFMGEVQL